MKEMSLALNFMAGAISLVIIDWIDLNPYRFDPIYYAMYILFVNAGVSFVLASRLKEK